MASRQQRQYQIERMTRLKLIASVAMLQLAAWAAFHHFRTVPDAALLDFADSRTNPGYRLDPNTAPWSELTALPGVGETKAKAISAYRDEVRARTGNPAETVFRSAADLQAVNGIGPKTATRIEPFLTFTSSSTPESANESPPATITKRAGALPLPWCPIPSVIIGPVCSVTPCG
ncbi:MAG: helix-hairpin-helix domain-containing protein [bacterium]|nr:helix-hairpin-helix domain-containing protein [bacterium]